MGSAGLVCPSCARPHPGSERFCESCGMPLVHPPGPPDGEGDGDDDRHRRARKIKPQYTEGKLVRVASAQNLVEAEFVENLLLDQGIPSLLRRSGGFDVPDFLAAGPREVLVPESAAEVARETLAPGPDGGEPASESGEPG